MEYCVGWSTYLMQTHSKICPPLEGKHTTEVVVIGGGMAGLFAAKTLLEAGKKVILIERTICGGGMSGRSGGFLTPDSELGLRQIEKRYGKEIAKKLRDFGQGGQDLIVNTARENNFDCDLQSEDSMLLGWKNAGIQEVKNEFDARQEYGYDGAFIARDDIKQHTTGKCYSAGLRYKNCYAINPMVYCQEMKNFLQKKGLQVFEQTTIQSYTKNHIITSRGTIDCSNMIFAVGKVTTDLHKEYAKDTYGIQNFITMSEPLSDTLVDSMFPQGKLMCRDTKMAFTYFRFTGDNRLVLGGGNMLTAGMPFDILYPYGIQSVVSEIKHVYDSMSNIAFDMYWNGRIQTTKDMMPIVDQDENNLNHRWVQGCVGLPRAAACGTLAAQKLLGQESTLTPFFLRKRVFWLPRRVQSPVLKALLYGPNNLYTMKYQKGY